LLLLPAGASLLKGDGSGSYRDDEKCSAPALLGMAHVLHGFAKRTHFARYRPQMMLVERELIWEAEQAWNDDGK
jgi:hypothetical protein